MNTRLAKVDLEVVNGGNFQYHGKPVENIVEDVDAKPGITGMLSWVKDDIASGSRAQREKNDP